jgi:hypothetical protein
MGMRQIYEAIVAKVCELTMDSVSLDLRGADEGSIRRQFGEPAWAGRKARKHILTVVLSLQQGPLQVADS